MLRKKDLVDDTVVVRNEISDVEGKFQRCTCLLIREQIEFDVFLHGIGKITQASIRQLMDSGFDEFFNECIHADMRKYLGHRNLLGSFKKARLCAIDCPQCFFEKRLKVIDV